MVYGFSAPDILQTKLAIPQARAELDARPRLIEQFDSGLSRPFTLISAPAGFGKTTLLSAWLASTGDDPVAWVSLDEDDNDPTRLLTYLVCALIHISSLVSDEVLPLLQTAQSPPPKVILTMRIRHLEAISNRFMLALIAEGLSNREFAAALFVGVGTVKKHLNNMFLKLDAHNRTEAIVIA